MCPKFCGLTAQMVNHLRYSFHCVQALLLTGQFLSNSHNYCCMKTKQTTIQDCWILHFGIAIISIQLVEQMFKHQFSKLIGTSDDRNCETLPLWHFKLPANDAERGRNYFPDLKITYPVCKFSVSMLVYFEYREWREKRRRSFLIQRHQWKNLSRCTMIPMTSPSGLDQKNLLRMAGNWIRLTLHR